ncbi:DUF7455 domain-containing protein [Ornithinimicrobium sufpigmenti]|uniref:DUF7455 domain-containing protein n=1 Tax=Ornithinimicrobium sufpigmenti TaxID=2508882 RepID=UPI001035B167|nr:MULTISPECIES: hypothetical protein [unclassified Ornithinimicrobium]
MNTTLTPELTAADRCDRCGAQAYVRARLADGLELHFCAHHGRAHLDKLRDMQDIDILDETHKLHAEENPTI